MNPTDILSEEELSKFESGCRAELKESDGEERVILVGGLRLCATIRHLQEEIKRRDEAHTRLSNAYQLLYAAVDGQLKEIVQLQAELRKRDERILALRDTLTQLALIGCCSYGDDLCKEIEPPIDIGEYCEPCFANAALDADNQKKDHK